MEAQAAAEKEAARLRRAAAKEEEEEERKRREEGRKEVVERLATEEGDADQIIQEGQKIVLKKSTARRTAAEKSRQAAKPPNGTFSAAPAADNGSAFTIKGLKPVEAREREKPYDPFGGLAFHTEYYALQDHYEHPWLDKARTDPHITAGGYSLGEYYARTMFEAFAGLGCFIQAEMAANDTPPNTTATASAALASGVGG